LGGDDYRRVHAQAAWALESLTQIIPAEIIDGLNWRWLAESAGRSPKNFLAAASEFVACDARTPLAELLRATEAGEIFPRVVEWTLIDARRVTLVPAGHWLLISDSERVPRHLENAEWRRPGGSPAIHPRRQWFHRLLRPARSGGGRGIGFGAPRDCLAKNFRGGSLSGARTAAARCPPAAARPGRPGAADQRPRRHGADLRGFGPREFQIRLRAGREPEPPCRWTATFSSSASASG
jgi:hypothetical protein